VRTLTIVISAALLFGSCSGNNEPADRDVNELSGVPAAPDSIVIELIGVDSVSVFELLQAEHEIEYRSTAAGKIVTEIDDVAVGGGYFWLYSVNDSLATVACDIYRTSDGDRVRWHFREIGK
jgi:hypothetical protein